MPETLPVFVLPSTFRLPASLVFFLEGLFFFFDIFLFPKITILMHMLAGKLTKIKIVATTRIFPKPTFRNINSYALKRQINFKHEYSKLCAIPFIQPVIIFLLNP
jgi:hypothetical protein